MSRLRGRSLRLLLRLTDRTKALDRRQAQNVWWNGRASFRRLRAPSQGNPQRAAGAWVLAVTATASVSETVAGHRRLCWRRIARRRARGTSPTGRPLPSVHAVRLQQGNTRTRRPPRKCARPRERSGTGRWEAGVGKTALLREAEARASELTLLRANGVQSESEIPYSSSS